MPEMMSIKVNGEARQVPPATTILALLGMHKLTPEKVAVELNKRLVKTANYATTLNPNDEVEIVTFVGGG